MPPRPKTQPPVAVVDLTDSDEDDGAGVNSEASSDRAASGTGGPLREEHPDQLSSATTPVSGDQQHQASDSRSFWKAGDYAVDPSAKPALISEDQLEHARVHPKFLHSNATSHKWAFGAIAELLDNAVDEIHNGATFVKVDKIDVMKDNSPALLFQDDGGGMDPECIRKCMSLGYSTKKTNTTIGQYGNGFKTSTMRLGADVIVLSRVNRKGHATQSVGLLSYTYLRKTGLDDVVVPMIDFDITSNWAEPIIYGSHDDWSFNLTTILEWSPFTSKEELMLQFDDFGAHGTKVIIYNLWLNDEGVYELSFDDDDEDIRLRDETNLGSSTKNKKQVQLESHISYRLRYSLRAYASMLYLKRFKNFSIILRGKPVEQYNIADELQHAMIVKYKPQLAPTTKEITVETKIGFIKEAPDFGLVCGFNVYHKNRLIKPFWKVTSEGSSRGNGVVGVLEANFIRQEIRRSLHFRGFREGGGPAPSMDVSSWFRRNLFRDSKNTKNPDLPDQRLQGDEDILGVTEKLIDFVKSFTLETFKDFPLSDEERDKRGEDSSGNVRNDLSEWQERHATLILSKVKEIALLRYKLCPRYLKEPQFWRIYFLLVKSHVAEYELLAIRRVKIKEMALENGKSTTDRTACEVEMAETKNAANLPPATP